MTATTPFPLSTTVGQGLFADPSAYGLIQGHAQPDPSVYWALRTAILATSETVPMWGGVAIYEDIPGGTGAPVSALGPIVGRATTVTGGSKPIAGFSVFDQAYGMVQSPQSPVPLAGSGMQVMTYRLGSGARIAVACDPSLIGLQGSAISSQVAWDFVNQMLVPYTGAVTISSGTYVTGTGVITLTLASTPSPFPGAGDSVTLSSLTGSGGYATLDGTWDVISGSGTNLVLQGPTGAGASAITGGSATTGAALPVSVLNLQASGCMTVVYNIGANTASWDYSGACALIQI